MKKSRKVLIIKTGFSEFLDRGISTTVSLGDVLMCTSILHLYKGDRVTWVTSWAARQLLEDNPYITERLIFGPQTLQKISRRSFDILINLEKDIGICTILSRIKAKQRYGFYFDTRTHDIATCNPSARYLLVGQENHRRIKKSLNEILFETVGARWDGEEVILNRKTQAGREAYDIGLNFSVGSKWPTKAWPKQHWQALGKLLGKRYRVSWQKGQKDLRQYMDWLGNCRLIVTSDSLGQILGQALGKKIVTLFGPTNPWRMKGFRNIHCLTSPLPCPHMPCYLPVCKFEEFCMEHIDPRTVADKCRELLP